MKKIKIFSEQSYATIEERVNKFSEMVDVVDVKIHEIYDISSDNGFVTVLVIYVSKQERDS